jgi:hypothetical protein
MAVHRKQYTKEFKEEALRLITQGGLSVAQVARDLDVNQSVLLFEWAPMKCCFARQTLLWQWDEVQFELDLVCALLHCRLGELGSLSTWTMSEWPRTSTNRIGMSATRRPFKIVPTSIAKTS